MNKRRTPKPLLLILVIFLTAYAPAELTRLIVEYLRMPWHLTMPVWQAVLELFVIWIGYAAGMALIWRNLK